MDKELVKGIAKEIVSVDTAWGLYPPFKFMTDNDGHWYLIPAIETESFKQWVYAEENCLDWPYKTYDQHRCMHPSSYTVLIVE